MPRPSTPTEDPTDRERSASLQRALDPRLNIPLQMRLELLQSFRSREGDEDTLKTDALLLRSSVALGRRLLKSHEELKEHINALTAPPLFPAVYLGRTGDQRARVAIGGGQRIINIAPELDPAQGETVLLNGERTMIMERAPEQSHLGEVASFQQQAPGGRVVLNLRGESLVCLPVNGLEPTSLRKGDLVLIDAPNNLAIERVTETDEGRLPFEVEEEVQVSREDVGGLGQELDTLLWTLLIGVEHRETALRHRITGFNSILLHGPPGSGKTLMARCAAGELQRRTGTKARFISVRPSEWRSEWVGSTERAIRETFAAIKSLASQGGHVVVFLDEAESLGRTRGGRNVTVLDDFTNALLTELDGFSGLTNVVVISATNRKDLLDVALRERLGSVDIAVPRPRMQAARSIFEIHLRAEDPWADDKARQEAIETALSLIYAPAGDSNDVSRIRFNDGSSRVIKASELTSGRLIRQIADNARRKAARRQIEGGEPGVRVDDLVASTGEAIDGLRTSLTRDNAESCLADLPQDLAIVAVEPVSPPHRRNRKPS